ncbi:carboxylesterase/lipase family protein [Microbacterium album]|uniref:Carboxylic ester hydrolase n=1 Tax=Microbacterium album TaxID=2053191 RepID=A0A917IFF6_9MICO|nr:carboxylesterase family protein [Microbacterium album]GGH48389.1 carboxylic ester hydrolase [Microbacterium album]
MSEAMVAEQSTVTVATDSGALRGLRDDAGIATFRGVPYAAPPVGERRWRPSTPPAPWEGVRPATTAGPAPLQRLPPRTAVLYRLNFDDRCPLVMSEDCLFLNVWTPDPSPRAALPVLVFLHGGGFRFGHGGLEVHDGAALARRGVVVVTLNMRLGALGFLAHPGLAAEDELGATGNYGVLDVVTALEWVQRNIGAFGGDPGRVTLAGNSAGAVIVTALMASPAAQGLFHAAIVQSSSALYRGQGPLPSAERAAEAGQAALGPLASATVSHLRDLSAPALPFDGPWEPVVDGRVVTESLEDVFAAGRQLGVPLLAGTNADEGTPYLAPDAPGRVRAVVEADAPDGALREAYPTGDAQLAVSARRFVTDTRFRYLVWRTARTHAMTSAAPTWLYLFDRTPPLPTDVDIAPPRDGGAGYGAFHTAELPYMADNLGVRRWPWQDADHELAAIMADTWARFVADHDPRGGGLPDWPALDGAPAAPSLVFGEEVRVEATPRSAALSALDGVPRPF